MIIVKIAAVILATLVVLTFIGGILSFITIPQNHCKVGGIEPVQSPEQSTQKEE